MTLCIVEYVRILIEPIGCECVKESSYEKSSQKVPMVYGLEA